jgi:hypothetical protein
MVWVKDDFAFVVGRPFRVQTASAYCIELVRRARAIAPRRNSILVARAG